MAAKDVKKAMVAAKAKVSKTPAKAIAAKAAKSVPAKAVKTAKAPVSKKLG